MASATTSSSSLRFMGLLKQPDSDPNPSHQVVELDESDVVWSSDLAADSYSYSASPSPPTLSSHISPSHHHHGNFHRHRHHFSQTKSGLSAALSDENHSLVRRKSTLNPSVAKNISAVVRKENHPPVKFPQSAPVNIPVWDKKMRYNYLERFDEVGDELDEEEEMVPPHVIVARSHVTFSVFEGVGRTLKGRDLRRVRNAVFQQTGFID